MAAPKRLPRLLRPPRWPAPLLLILLSAGGLAWVFCRGLSDAWPAYGIYALSAYTTVMAAVGGVRLLRRGRAALHRFPLTHKYLTEAAFKAEVSLRLSLLIDLFYSAWKAWAGIRFRSPWFGALAFYYIVLAAERAYLLHALPRARQDPAASLRKYRFCGGLLLVLTAAVAAVGYQAVFGGNAARYPGHMIYGAAAYTFYKLYTAAASLIRCRRLRSPVHTAAMAVSLAAALTALFSLQTAMLAAFGGDAGWRLRMSAGTGCAVLGVILAMSLIMLAGGRRKVRGN